MGRGGVSGACPFGIQLAPGTRVGTLTNITVPGHPRVLSLGTALSPGYVSTLPGGSGVLEMQGAKFSTPKCVSLGGLIQADCF